MRISVGSLTFSWIIAFCLLGLISVWSHPPLQAADSRIIEIPALTSSLDISDREHLQATAWCALDKNQIARVSVQGQNEDYRGAMAIAPQWQGQPLTGLKAHLLEDCVKARLSRIRPDNADPSHNESSFAYLFSNL